MGGGGLGWPPHVWAGRSTSAWLAWGELVQPPISGVHIQQWLVGLILLLNFPHFQRGFSLVTGVGYFFSVSSFVGWTLVLRMQFLLLKFWNGPFWGVFVPGDR